MTGPFAGLVGPLQRDPATGALLLSVDTSAVTDVRVTSERLNIMEGRFGADPADLTGTTNKAAILAAVSYAQGASRARIVIPEHEFLVNGLLVLDHDDLTIEGVDPYLSALVLAPNSNSGVVRFNAAATSDGTQMRSRNRLRRLRINQQGSQQANQGSGIEAAVVFHQVNDGEIEGLHLQNARNTGIDARIGSRLKIHGKNVIDTIINGGLGGNAMNIGGASQGGGPLGTYITVEDVDIIGSNTRLADGTVTAGVLTSPSYTFTAADVGKQLIVHSPSNVATTSGITLASISGGGVNLGLGSVAASNVTFSFGYIDIAAQISSNVKRLLMERVNVIGGCNSGVVVEGGGTGTVVVTGGDIAASYVESARNIAFGWGDASGSTTSLKSQRGNLEQCIAVNPQVGLAMLGRNLKATDFNVYGYYANGAILGGGNYDENDLQLKGFTIEADPTATGAGLLVNKSDVNNQLKELDIGPGRIYGAGIASYGAALQGNVLDAVLDRVRITHYGWSGLLVNSAGGASPSELHLRKVIARNNNRALSATATQQNGIAILAGDSITFDDCRSYDDQTISAIVTNASANITVASLPKQGYYPANGTPITGTGIPAGTTVLSGGGTANLVLSANATAGDGVTAITLTAKTQKFGLYWLGATRGRFRKTELRGNSSGAKNVSFDANTIYEGGGNIEVDDKYAGAATIGNGFNVDVLTTAARTGAIIVVVGRNVQQTADPLVANGSKFTINGPNGTYDWRIL